MNEILRFLSANKDKTYSDVHIEQGKPMRFRTPNGWEDAGFGIVSDEHLVGFLGKVDNFWKHALQKKETMNVSLDLANVERDTFGRFRCCVYTIDSGRRIAASLRRIHPEPMSLEETGVPALVTSFVNAPKGMLLVTGPTGSGKTTTIMSLLSRILSRRNVHVVTIEDPVEYVLAPGAGIVSQREVKIDTLSFSDGLKDALRQRPDVIMVGEVRDPETAVTALRAAESGHFVVATVHARSAIGALQKMQTLAGEDAYVGSSIVGVLAQVLLPAMDGSQFVMAPEFIHLNDPDIQAKVNQCKWDGVEEILKRGDKGCISQGASLANLIRRGAIKKEDALLAAYDVQNLARSVQ